MNKLTVKSFDNFYSISDTKIKNLLNKLEKFLPVNNNDLKSKVVHSVVLLVPLFMIFFVFSTGGDILTFLLFIFLYTPLLYFSNRIYHETKEEKQYLRNLTVKGDVRLKLNLDSDYEYWNQYLLNEDYIPSSIRGKFKYHQPKLEQEFKIRNYNTNEIEIISNLDIIAIYFLSINFNDIGKFKEDYLFPRLFTYFCNPTKYSEYLPKHLKELYLDFLEIDSLEEIEFIEPQQLIFEDYHNIFKQFLILFENMDNIKDVVLDRLYGDEYEVLQYYDVITDDLNISLGKILSSLVKMSSLFCEGYYDERC